MVDSFLRRSQAVVLALALACGFWAGCAFYAPTPVDCSVTCGDNGPCPRGTSCKSGFCRLPAATTDCACRLGDTRPCGGGKGECKPGTEICTSERVWSGVCVNEGKAKPEVCNNKDDDCNGLTDDDVTDGQPCALRYGVCAGKKARCELGVPLACDPSDYGPTYQASEALCDGLDNDCDSQVDARHSVALLNDAAPSGEWQMLALPGGYAVVYERKPLGGASELAVARFDSALTFQRATVVARPGPLEFHARAVGDDVFVASSIDGGVSLVRVNTLQEGDAGLAAYQTATNAEFFRGIRLGVGDRLVATFVGRNDTLARVLTWSPATGRVLQMFDLNNGPGAPASTEVYSANVSDRANFVIYGAKTTGSDARQLIKLGDAGVWNCEYYGGTNSDLYEIDGGGVSSAYLYSPNSGVNSGIYYVPDLTSSNRAESAAVSSPNLQQFVSLGSYLNRREGLEGTLYTVQHERPQTGTEFISVTKSVPQGATNTWRVRSLDGGAGYPQVALSNEAGWLFVGWRENSIIRVAKVCVP